VRQQVAGRDEPVVLDRQPDDRPGDLRRDLHHLGAHLAVAGPRVDHVVPVPPGEDADGQQDDGGGDEDLRQCLHGRHTGIRKVPISGIPSFFADIINMLSFRRIGIGSSQ
jgi:hypothetical protein